MANGWKTAPLAQVLRQDTNYVTELEPITYPKLSVKLYGKGVTLDAPADGANVKMQRHQFAKPGQVILSEIWAKKGAIGIVPLDGEGALVTSHFFLFDIDETKVLPAFIGWLLKGNLFAELLDAQAHGTTGYAAVRPKQFLALEIPLPPLTEQRCIVAHIEALAARVAEAQSLRREAGEEVSHLINSAKSQIYSNHGKTTVKDFADIQSGYAFKSEWFTPDGIRLVRNVNIGHGDIRWDETARIPADRRSEFPSFELNEGDILISLDRPLISSGLKAARVRKQDLPSLLLQRVGRVIFKSNKVLPEFFFEWLHSPMFYIIYRSGKK